MRTSRWLALAVLAACSGSAANGGDDGPGPDGPGPDGPGPGIACDVTAGVAPQAEELALPDGYSRFLGVNWDGPLCDGANIPGHSVMDLTGDGAPDLVVTERCGDDLVGRTHWLVYPGSATGFGAPLQFALPPEYSKLLGVAWNERLCNGTNIPAHAVMDMTGDGKPDLLVTDRCNDTQIDRTHWLVYASSGTGFAATPAQFALPAGYSRFFGVAQQGPLCTNSNVPEHVTLDVTDDGLPDLLVTDRCNDTEISRTHWVMYPGTSAGFGAATELALPGDYTRLFGAAWTQGPLCNGTNIPEHVLMDLRGDDRPDLVVIGRCNDAAVSRDHWLVYTADASGFAATPVPYALPDGYDRFIGVAWQGPLCTSSNVPEHVTMDVDGDRRPDVLVTDRCNDDAIGRDHWLVYKGSEAGFAAAPTTFALPDGYDRFLGAAWEGALCDGRNIPEHVMLDANADGRPDLLVTNRCNDDAIDRTHWLVYTNQCAP